MHARETERATHAFSSKCRHRRHADARAPLTGWLLRSVMGGEQAAGVLAQVKRDALEKRGGEWPLEEEEAFKAAHRARLPAAFSSKCRQLQTCTERCRRTGVPSRSPTSSRPPVIVASYVAPSSGGPRTMDYNPTRWP